MSNRSNQNLKLGLGILAGAALGYWLNSDQGRKTRTEVANKAEEYGNQAATYVKEQANSLGSQVNDYYEQGRSAVANAAETVRTTLSTSTPTPNETAYGVIDDVEDQLKKGIERARKKIVNATEKVA